MNHRFPYWNCHHVNNFQIPSMIQTVRSIWKQILCSFPFVYLVNTRACLKMEDTNSITMFLENMVKNYNKRSKFGDTVWCKSLSCQILSTSSDLWIWEDPFGAAKDRSPRSPRRIIQVSLTLHTTQAPDAVRSKTRNSLRNHLFVPCKKTGQQIWISCFRSTGPVLWAVLWSRSSVWDALYSLKSLSWDVELGIFNRDTVAPRLRRCSKHGFTAIWRFQGTRCRRSIEKLDLKGGLHGLCCMCWHVFI